MKPIFILFFGLGLALAIDNIQGAQQDAPAQELQVLVQGSHKAAINAQSPATQEQKYPDVDFMYPTGIDSLPAVENDTRTQFSPTPCRGVKKLNRDTIRYIQRSLENLEEEELWRDLDDEEAKRRISIASAPEAHVAEAQMNELRRTQAIERLDEIQQRISRELVNARRGTKLAVGVALGITAAGLGFAFYELATAHW